jgi:ATP-dependent helicase/nuclease subunit B
MARTLLLGRAGSGKTRLLLDQVAGRIRAGSDDRALLLVPTYGRGEHLKRSLLGLLGGDPPGFLDRTVVTFTSLAERVLGGTPIGALASPALRDHLLRRALAEAGGDVFARVREFPGFRARFLALVKEVKESALSDGEARAALEDLARSLDGRAARRRMEAFARVFAVYSDLLRAGHRLDHEDFQGRLLDAVRAAAGTGRPPGPLARVEWLGVDGFTNFTALQEEVVNLLADLLPEAVVTLPFDPERPPLFASSADPRERFRAWGWRTEQLGPSGRAAPGGDLARVEAALFRDGPVEARAPDGSLRLLECADPADEADRVARTAALWIRRDGWAAREILVVHRGLGAARPLLEEAFERHGVPICVFAPRPLPAEPLVRAAMDLARLALGVADGGTAIRAVRSACTAGGGADGGDRLAAAAAEAGLPRDAAGARALAEEKGLPEAAALVARLIDGAADAPAAPEALRDAVLRALAVPDRLRTAFAPGPSLPGAAPVPDRARGAAEAAALSVLLRLVAETAATLRREGLAAVPPRRFLEDLEAAAARASFQPPDRRLHAVSAVDVEEARQWEARGVLLAGLNEKVFPRAPREDLFLRDRDRERANAAGRDPARPRGRLRFAYRLRARDEERLLFYVACTRARERLVLSWPVAGADGERRLRSSFLDEVDRLWPEGGSPRAVSTLADPAPLPGEAVHRADLLRGALLRCREPAVPGTGAGDRMLRAGAVLDALAARSRGRRDADIARAAALSADPVPRLPRGPLLARRLRPFRTSASALGAHAQCRYLHFAGNVLRLEAPVRADEEGLDALRLGSAVHGALEEWFRGGRAGDPGSLFDAAFAEEMRGLRPGLDDRVRARRAREALVAFAASEGARVDARRPLGPVAEEAAFGERGGWPALVLRAGGRRVEVRGRLDRLDADAAGNAVAVDYKMSFRGRKYGEREHAEALADGDPQVPLYLVALRDAAGLVPAGVEIADVVSGRITGIRVEGAPPTVAPDRASVVVAPGDIDGIARALAARARAAADALARGDVTPRPKDADRCGPGECRFADLCRFEKWRLAGAGR